MSHASGHGFRQRECTLWQQERNMRGVGRGDSHSDSLSYSVPYSGQPLISNTLSQLAPQQVRRSLSIASNSSLSHSSYPQSLNSSPDPNALAEANIGAPGGETASASRVEPVARRPRRYRSIAERQHDDQTLAISHDPQVATTGLIFTHLLSIVLLVISMYNS